MEEIEPLMISKTDKCTCALMLKRIFSQQKIQKIQKIQIQVRIHFLHEVATIDVQCDTWY